MLVLSNEEIQQICTMPACLQVLEDAYLELGQLRAANRPRSDLYSEAMAQHTYYIFKSMEGIIPKLGIAALRINSDIIEWKEIHGNIVKEKIPRAPGGKWVGLVYLFSTTTGEFLAIYPDGFVQRMRVGATNGLGIKYLARQNASKIGLLGSGWQAGAQLLAAASVRKIVEVKVFSPNRTHREEFVKTMCAELPQIDFRAVTSTAEAMDGVDIIITATNSITPVVTRDMVKPGVHVTCIKHSELDPKIVEDVDVLVINSRKTKPDNYFVGKPNNLRIEDHDPVSSAKPQYTAQWEQAPELQELMAGKVKGRKQDSEITCFINNIGIGLQFAATGALIYQTAKEGGLGREISTDWFVQDVHP